MILIFGSSTTWGAWDEKGGWAERLKDYAYIQAAANNFENYTTVYPLGVDGDDTKKLLKRFDAEVDARKWEDEKIHIIISIGVNDSWCFNDDKNNISVSEYKENLLQLIKKSKAHNADLAFVSLTPVDERVDPVPWRPEISYKMKYINEYNAVLQNVCAEQNIHLVETTDKLSDTKMLLSDGLHPNTKGHEIIYNQVLPYLQEQKYI